MANDDTHALVLQISAQLTNLEKSLKKAQGETRAAAKHMEQSAGMMERALGNPAIGKGLDNIFSDARQRAMDAGTSRLGVFGGALEALGPAGMVAGAGIGVFSAALAGALAAAQYADELADAANKIHVTTTALQEYRYALRLAGGEEKGADQALEAFSVTLGKAQEGLTKAQRAFLLLGFSKEQIAAFRTSDEALRAVMERLAEIESNPRRDALISLLGLDSMKPLIQGGVEEMERLRAEARAVGVVMDEELVQAGAQINDQFETLTQIVGVELKSALLELGPLLVQLMEFAAGVARMLGKVADLTRSDLGQKVTGVLGKAVSWIYGGPALQMLSRAGVALGRHLGWFDPPSDLSSAPAAGAPMIPRSSEAMIERLSGRSTGGGRARRASGRAAQPLKAVEVFDPEIMEILDALDYWQSVERRGNELRPTLDVSGDFVATLDEQLQGARDATYQSLYDGVRTGLEAGFYGGVPGVVDYLKAQLMRAVLDSLAKTLAEVGAGSGSGSSGSGSWVKTAVMAVLTGSFATGTNYAPGGLAMVGERGPELVNLPRGSTVTPHGLADIRPRASAGPVVIHADFTGAVVTQELMASFQAYADQVGARAAAEGAARGSAEAQARIYTRARNRLGR